jgi:hypothetical protein
MLDTPRPGPLAKFQDSIGVVTTEKMKPTGRADKPEQNPSSEIGGGTYRQWAGSRDKNLLDLRSKENFFLDIPFYRTH